MAKRKRFPTRKLVRMWEQAEEDRDVGLVARMEFGGYLERLRNQLNLTEEQFAKKIGKGAYQYKRMLKADSNLGLDHIAKIAHRCGMKLKIEFVPE